MYKLIDSINEDDQIYTKAMDNDSGKTVRAIEKRYICSMRSDYNPTLLRKFIGWEIVDFIHLSRESDATCV